MGLGLCDCWSVVSSVGCCNFSEMKIVRGGDKVRGDGAFSPGALGFVSCVAVF